jgi:hypothetical protein
MERRPKRLVSGAVLAFGLIAIAAAPAQAPPRHADRATTLTVASRGVMIRAKLGSHCLPGRPNENWCADLPFDPMPTRGRLPVRPGDGLTIRVSMPARVVSVQLMRTGADRSAPEVATKAIRARAVGSSGRRWSVTLPADLARADLVSVFARYPAGDANFSARLLGNNGCTASK